MATIIRYAFFSFVLTMIPLFLAAQITKVYYSPPSEELDIIKTYNKKILELALDKTSSTYGPYELADSDDQLSQRDALKRLNSENIPYIVPTMTDVNRERVFIPIRVPIYKGLFGIRLMLTQKRNNARVLDSNQVGNYSYGQGTQWPDTRILKQNDLNVVEMDEKSDLFEGARTGQFDFFPRAVVEIWEELEKESQGQLKVHPDFYFYYPTAIYFFVAKNMEGVKLAKRIEEGLNIAVDDGSFDDLFAEYIEPFLIQAELGSKKMISLDNPNLPAKTPIGTSKYWIITPDS